jgi:HSP20 family protein
MAESKQQGKTGERSGNGSKQSGAPKGGALAQSKNRPLSSPYYFAPLSRLRNEFDRLFDEFFQGWPTSFRGREMQRSWGLDVDERDDAIVVKADAPGFEPGDFDIQVRGDNLVLCACQSEESRHEDQGYQFQKRELHHTVPLDAAVDSDKIEAEYRHGVLTITLPKTEESRTRKIEVKG